MTRRPSLTRKCIVFVSFWRPIRATRTYGPYVRAACTARTYGCIFDTRTYGPYLRVVRTGLKTACGWMYPHGVVNGWNIVVVSCEIRRLLTCQLLVALSSVSAAETENKAKSTNVRPWDTNVEPVPWSYFLPVPLSAVYRCHSISVLHAKYCSTLP